MTTMSPTVSSSEPVQGWRDRIKLTRAGIFGGFFIIVGALLLWGAQSVASSTTTTLTTGAGLAELIVPTQPYMLVIGILWLLGGIAALFLPKGARLKNIWLPINGLLIIPTVLIVAAAGNSTNVAVLLQVSMRQATPVVLGALAGIWCERSGVTNIAIEGMMLTGACFGFVAFTLLLGTFDTPTSQFLGVIVAVLAGGIMAVLHAWLSITFRTNQIVSGTVINILAVGITSFTRREVLLSSEAGRETLQAIAIPGLSELPVVGEIFFNGRPIFYGMFVLLFVTHIVLFYTRWGLRTRAVGENPKAADTLGINVLRNRWVNVLIGGLIAGLAGAWFSLENVGSFDDNMTSGRGFIALAVMIFGNYMPFGAFGGGILYGFADSLGTRFQALGVPVPSQFMQMVPYVITIVVLAGLVGRSVAPKAGGVAYEKEGK
jgi:general nucleoside transport system permease protein